MKRFYMFIAGLLSVTMLFSVNAAAEETDSQSEETEFVSPFEDVSEETENYEEIFKMYEAGYIKGYGDDSFKPDGNITRAELVVILNQLFMYDSITEYTKTFTDVSEANWYYEPVMKAGTAGYIAGFPDGGFKPDDNFTRQQFCVVLSQINSFEKLDYDKEIKDEVSAWASDYVYKVLSNRVMFLEDGDTFRALENITRGEVCGALAGFIVEEQDETETTTEDDEDATETTTSKSTSSSSGGGGSSSSSKSTTTTTTTESTTETTTTTTTTTTTEATTESTTSSSSTDIEDIDLDSISSVTLSDEAITKLKTVISGLRSALSSFETTDEKELAKYLISSMNSYISDASYDISSAAETAKEMYTALSSDEKEDFQYNVRLNVSISTLLYFGELFGLI